MEEPPAARPSAACAPVPATAPSPVMALLQDHLPLTLLLDLAWGVRSQDVYDAEPADLSWLRRTGVA